MQRNNLSVTCITALILSALFSGSISAQSLTVLDQYRFLPRHSTLHVEGGFAGFDILADIGGTFSFVNNSIFPSPQILPFAAFFDVDAVAINPTDFGPYSFDIDETLNLTGLIGEPLPVAAPFDVIKFHGEDGQGARMDLTVIKFGRWLYMNGSNDSPCCDFFDYEIEAIARRTPFADFSDDAGVDGNDLTTWTRSFGYDARGDADGDNDTDGGDFLSWQRQFGDSMPSLETFATVAALSSQQAVRSAVPEPSSLLLFSICLLAMPRRGCVSL